jgi:hypothetical protein
VRHDCVKSVFAILLWPDSTITADRHTPCAKQVQMSAAKLALPIRLPNMLPLNGIQVCRHVFCSTLISGVAYFHTINLDSGDSFAAKTFCSCIQACFQTCGNLCLYKHEAIITGTLAPRLYNAQIFNLVIRFAAKRSVAVYRQDDTSLQT